MWCWRRLESPLDCKQIQPFHPKGNQSWVFTGRTDAEAETPVLLPPDAKNWLISKDPDAGQDWRQEEKGMTEVEMVGWHHRLDGHMFEQALGIVNGQGSLACCSPWGHKESDTTEQLNWKVYVKFRGPWRTWFPFIANLFDSHFCSIIFSNTPKCTCHLIRTECVHGEWGRPLLYRKISGYHLILMVEIILWQKCGKGVSGLLLLFTVAKLHYSVH